MPTFDIMYEHKNQQLASTKVLYRRILTNVNIAIVILSFFMVVGTVGYHYAFSSVTCSGQKYNWLDAFHNAAMILSGMGPVVTELNDGGKIFSSFYAIFSGVVFISTIGLILTPVIHRLFHKFHLEDSQNR